MGQTGAGSCRLTIGIGVPPQEATGAQAASLTRAGVLWHTVARVAVSLITGWTRTTRRPGVSTTSGRCFLQTHRLQSLD